jgi:hypothetical protein
VTTWNYRIVRYTNGGLGLHEVYYDEAGMITGRTENPCSFACDEEEGPEGIIGSLEMALKDAKEKAVVQDPF